MFIMLIIVFLLILFFFNKFSENMTNNYNKYLNNEMSTLIRNNVYKFDELIEITNLPKCNKNIMVDYGLNIGSINNDNVTINQIY